MTGRSKFFATDGRVVEFDDARLTIDGIEHEITSIAYKEGSVKIDRVKGVLSASFAVHTVEVECDRGDYDAMVAALPSEPIGLQASADGGKTWKQVPADEARAFLAKLEELARHSAVEAPILLAQCGMCGAQRCLCRRLVNGEESDPYALAAGGPDDRE